LERRRTLGVSGRTNTHQMTGPEIVEGYFERKTLPHVKVVGDDFLVEVFEKTKIKS
jgi:hypothetical protein